ncbi:DUF4282 domain-containing protein [Yimella sp. cx-51]|uniref:DUF4282 domain-containing protein n=1 Tax=Yimella sp. cx-51 TaxID=2770551 RepID=UPI00165E53D6|nr:DUF4282 domain-containing protein [Yimella sp. cx-51]MBC9957864.1 hypothetical protein [Yimella sp. cx-51]QTH37999.1 hypothetical protein J5M86_14405 [Yimella sp. cx-51]
MSQPTNGSWNDGQGQGGSLGQGWNDQSNQGGGSLGQDWGGQQSQQSASGQDYGQQGGYGGQQYGQQGDQGQYGQSQGNYDQGQQGGAPAHTGGYNNSPSSSGASPFSDTKFEQSLTPKIASLAFMLISAAAIIWGLYDILYNFLGEHQSVDGSDREVVVKMHVVPAIFKMLADIAIVGAIIYGARVVIELAVNVAKIAQRDN